MPDPAERADHSPVEYRDARRRLWYVSEVAQMKVVSASIDGPSRFLVIRFEREGEERFARWIGGDDWRQRGALHRLFTEAEPAEAEETVSSATVSEEPNDESGVGAAPIETVRLWCELVRSMGPDELESFEARTFRQWDPASLGELRGAIRRRRQVLGEA
jgi:hypothetical protein